RSRCGGHAASSAIWPSSPLIGGQPPVHACLLDSHLSAGVLRGPTREGKDAALPATCRGSTWIDRRVPQAERGFRPSLERRKKPDTAGPKGHANSHGQLLKEGAAREQAHRDGLCYRGVRELDFGRTYPERTSARGHG